jgi:hypothetical protein
MRIRMICTQRGARDGLTVELFLAGTEHDLSESVGARSLAATFVDKGWAEPVLAASAHAAPAAPESRAHARAPSNKGGARRSPNPS